MLATISGKRQYQEIMTMFNQQKQTQEGGIITMYDIEEEIFQRGVRQGEQQGIQQGLQQEIQQGVKQTLLQNIQSLIRHYHKNNILRPTACRNLSEIFSLSPEEAEAYLAQYW